LTVVEVARLQGFPDTFCHIETNSRRKIDADEAEYMMGHGLRCWQEDEQWYTKIAADGPMYRSYGNSMAVPVIRWIGKRIKAAEDEQPGQVGEDASHWRTPNLLPPNPINSGQTLKAAWMATGPKDALHAGTNRRGPKRSV
jgi:hypothetical protein